MSFILSPSSPWEPPDDWLFSLQVAEVVCSVQVGGSGSHGDEDGNRAGQDEVYKTALQVFILSSLHDSHTSFYFTEASFQLFLGLSLRT